MPDVIAARSNQCCIINNAPRLYLMFMHLLFERSKIEGKSCSGNESKHSLLARNIIRRAGNRERTRVGRATEGRLGNAVVRIRARPQTRIFHRILSNFPAIARRVPGFGSWLMEQRTYHELQEGERRCALPIV